MHRFIEQFANSLTSHVPISEDILLSWIEIPPNPAMGDLALPCFRLAKELRMSPQAIAQDLASRLEDAPFIQRVETAGAYLNVHLNRHFASAMTLTQLRDNRDFFTSARGEGKTAAIDLSSPNIAKPFSMGHLRSTVIGTAIANLLQSDGFHVLRINHLGDWGTQFGKIIVAYKRWGDEEKVKGNPISELNALYVQFHEEAKEHPELEDEARLTFKRLEDGDGEYLALWRWMIEVSLAEFNRTYKLLGTTFTHSLGESFYNDKMDAVVADLKGLGLLVESEGADVVMLDDAGLPPCLIRRSDGATLYATRDLAAALYRHRELGANRLFYVVGGEQRLHFQQVFRVLSLMGYDFSQDCSHVAFGLMRLGGKKMSTRKGQVVRLQDVLEEAVSRAKDIISEKNPSLPGAEAVARSIGVGAVVFNDLKTHRLHDIDFALDTALAFEGETGPYVQYTHARCCSVLRKAGFLAKDISPETPVAMQDLADSTFSSAFADDASWELVKQISLFPGVRLRGIDEQDPSLIAKHALDVCQAFNRFYHDCTILGAVGSLRDARLALTDATRLTVRAALSLLGIDFPAEI